MRPLTQRPAFSIVPFSRAVRRLLFAAVLASLTLPTSAYSEVSRSSTEAQSEKKTKKKSRKSKKGSHKGKHGAAAKRKRSKGAALGFSNLVVRLKKRGDIELAGDDLRVHLLESLRKAGVNAVGAESLVFGKDNSHRSDLLLGGTVKEFECRRVSYFSNCYLGILWEVLDVAQDRVVFRKMSRTVRRKLDSTIAEHKPGKIARALVIKSAKALSRRKKFKRLLRKSGRTALALKDETYPVARVAQCQALGKMPEATQQALQATLLVRSGKAFGSAFLIDQRLALTAAHVIHGSELEVRTKDGSTIQAVPIRISRRFDAALLRLAEPPKGATCLRLNTEAKSLGSDVYAIGSPASQQLAFSLSRGIISGVRNLEGGQFLQTDAAISPGNSGGPMLNTTGEAIALVSWKLAGATVEGIAFGVPSEVAMSALGLIPGNQTDATLLASAPVGIVGLPQTRKVVVDKTDARPDLTVYGRP